MRVFITGGAGFIGSHMTAYWSEQGAEVTVFDSLIRRGAQYNLHALQQKYPQIKHIQGDVRDFEALKNAMAGADLVLHFAGQVAVTTSVVDPRNDFEVNALGTFNVLEAARHQSHTPILFNFSTNKVYGHLDHFEVVEQPTRYAFADGFRGITEATPLDFHSPYGCSKGTGDQYVRDYARIYGMQNVVFRMSCIYGPRQFGIEDQGWLAHFVISALLNRPITIFGNGKQVRDVLFVGDLVQAVAAAVQNIDQTAGKIYNIGGGLENSLAVWTEFAPLLEEVSGIQIPVKYAEWRPGDQKIYISDTTRAGQDFGWQPTVSPREGIFLMSAWIQENLAIIKTYLSSPSQS